MKPLREEWAAKVVGHLFYLNVTRKEFAYYMGITEPYLSSVLNGKKEFESEYAKKQTQKRIVKALEGLEYERLRHTIHW